MTRLPIALTAGQLRVATAIARLCVEHGQPPTIVEIAAELGIGKIAVYEHLQILDEKGGLAPRRRHARRSLRLSARLAAQLLMGTGVPIICPGLEGLTPKQSATMRAIHRSWRQRGIAPTLAELADEFHINRVTVHERIRTLIGLGLVSRDHRRQRGLRIVVRSNRRAAKSGKGK